MDDVPLRVLFDFDKPKPCKTSKVAGLPAPAREKDCPVKHHFIKTRGKIGNVGDTDDTVDFSNVDDLRLGSGNLRVRVIQPFRIHSALPPLSDPWIAGVSSSRPAS